MNFGHIQPLLSAAETESQKLKTSAKSFGFLYTTGAPTFIHVFIPKWVGILLEGAFLFFIPFLTRDLEKPHTYLLANPVQYGFGQHGFFEGTFVMEGTFCTFCYLNHILHNANLEWY